MPDIRFLAEQRENVLGIVATHAHEDHIGAIAPLWPSLRCPIYATPFTAAADRRQAGRGGPGRARCRSTRCRWRPADAWGRSTLRFHLHHPFHPGAQCCWPSARRWAWCAHTGDWKIDPDPLLGERPTSRRCEKLGDEGVLALVCDSTNALVPGSSGSEADGARQPRSKLIGTLQGPGGGDRLRLQCGAAGHGGARRQGAAASVALVGRSMQQHGRGGARDRLSEGLSARAGRERRGRPAAATRCCISAPAARASRAPRWRASRSGDHRGPRARGRHGDLFLAHHSRQRDARSELQNKLCARGVEVLTDDDHFVHVSGHPARDELAACIAGCGRRSRCRCMASCAT